MTPETQNIIQLHERMTKGLKPGSATPANAQDRRVRRWITGLSWINLAAILIVTLLIVVISEGWWLGTVVLYLPRIPWILPTLILLPLSAWYSRRAAILNGIALVLILWPVMNLQTGGLWAGAVDEDAYALTIVTCNVQSFRPDFPTVVNELHRIDPDIVLFQEAFEDHRLLKTFFDGWNVERVDEYLVASKLPLKFIDSSYVESYERVTGTWFEVETPHGPLALFNVHQTSPRKSLTRLRPWSGKLLQAITQLHEETTLRDVEALKTREMVQQRPTGQPAVIVGDFNMPNDSSLFQSNWGDFVDAYATTNVGYGYTNPCHMRLIWPENTPWAQVDHILTTHHLQVERCWVGTGAGSDHRLMAARIHWPKPLKSPAPAEAPPRPAE